MGAGSGPWWALVSPIPPRWRGVTRGKGFRWTDGWIYPGPSASLSLPSSQVGAAARGLAGQTNGSGKEIPRTEGVERSGTEWRGVARPHGGGGAPRARTCSWAIIPRPHGALPAPPLASRSGFRGRGAGRPLELDWRDCASCCIRSICRCSPTHSLVTIPAPSRPSPVLAPAWAARRSAALLPSFESLNK